MSRPLVAIWRPHPLYMSEVWVTSEADDPDSQGKYALKNLRGHPRDQIETKSECPSIVSCRQAASEIAGKAKAAGLWLGPYVGVVLLKAAPMIDYDTADPDFDPERDVADEQGGSARVRGISLAMAATYFVATPDNLAIELKSQGARARIRHVETTGPTRSRIASALRDVIAAKLPAWRELLQEMTAVPPGDPPLITFNNYEYIANNFYHETTPWGDSDVPLFEAWRKDLLGEAP